MGAGRPDEARRYTRKHCMISWCVVLGTSLFFLVLTPSICRLSGLSAPAAELTFRMLLLITVMKLLFWVPAFTLPNTLRAAGDVSFTALVSAVSMWVFRVGLSALLCRALGFGLIGVWIGWFTDWVCRLIIYVARYRIGTWAKKDLLGEKKAA